MTRVFSNPELYSTRYKWIMQTFGQVGISIDRSGTINKEFSRLKGTRVGGFEATKGHMRPASQDIFDQPLNTPLQVITKHGLIQYRYIYELR